MKSKNPKVYTKKDKLMSFGKFQPARSPVFSKLPTIDKKQQQYAEKTKQNDQQ